MHLMKRTCLMLCVLAWLGLWTGPGQASQALRLNLDDLIERADLVAVVEVGTCQSAWGPNKRLIHTRCSLKVQEILAGESSPEIDISQPGGRVGRWAQVTQGYHAFRKGERLLLFLQQPAERARVVGMSQGVFRPEASRWRQALSGLSFPGDSALALEFKADKMLERIRSTWRLKAR